jgi:D-glycero-D-manno-heptose 1,7-bisphosphate phosphatase
VGAEKVERADMSGAPRRAVFLDRDGTLIEDVDYLTDAAQIRVLPGVPGALKLLKEAGFRLIVVTNQSAVARGMLTEEELGLIHEELNRRLAADGAAVDAFYYCPHLPEGAVKRYARACDCRKPAPGLILRAAAEWRVDTGASFAVGDSERDVEAGRAAGCRTILTGAVRSRLAGAHAADLAAAVDLILGK